jgi:hypothetical protein
MYCGDETGSFVGEIGSGASRFGYGGDDAPKLAVPSFCLDRGGGDKKPQRAPSCYRWRGGEGGRGGIGIGDPYRTPLRRAAPNHYSYDDDRDRGPIVDPDAHLPEGECVGDWDCYEALWESALDTLNARDPFKHATSSRPNAAAARRQHASGATSQSLPGPMQQREQDASRSALVHPLLVVRPGFTHLAGGPPPPRVDRRPAAAADDDDRMAVDGDGDDDRDPAARGPADLRRADPEDPPGSPRHESLHRAEMARLAELAVESLGCPALFEAPAPMLAAFAHGRQTALVVDVGASGW